MTGEAQSGLELFRTSQSHRMSQRYEMLQFFLGSKDGTEDPVEFVENVEFHIDGSEYSTLAKVTKATRVLFRMHLKGKARE